MGPEIDHFRMKSASNLKKGCPGRRPDENITGGLIFDAKMGGLEKQRQAFRIIRVAI